MMSVQDLANSINKDVDEWRLTWAYGLIRETYQIWMIDDNKKLLNDDALNLLDIAADDPKTIH